MKKIVLADKFLTRMINNDWDFTFIKILSFFNLHTLNIEQSVLVWILFQWPRVNQAWLTKLPLPCVSSSYKRSLRTALMQWKCENSIYRTFFCKYKTCITYKITIHI